MASPSNMTVTVADPVSADIQAVAGAVKSVMDFLCTPEGQETVKAWRESAAAFDKAIKDAGTWIEGLFK